MSTINRTMTIRSTTCGVCGILFGLEAHFMAARIDDGKNFCCPNGHRISWDAANEHQKTEQKLASAEIRLRATRDQLSAAIRDAERQRQEVLRIQSRISHGVCPCCQRSFKQVRDHMASQHPEYVKSLPSAKPYKCGCGRTFSSYMGLRRHQSAQRSEGWDAPQAARWSSHLTVV